MNAQTRPWISFRPLIGAAGVLACVTLWADPALAQTADSSADSAMVADTLAQDMSQDTAAGVSLLRSRLEQARAEAAALVQERDWRAAVHAERERHIGALRHLLSSQEQLIEALRLQGASAATTRTVDSAAATAEPPLAPVDATLPVTEAVTVGSTPAAEPLAGGDALIAHVAGVAGWLRGLSPGYAAALAGTISIALLGLLLRVRLRRWTVPAGALLARRRAVSAPVQGRQSAMAAEGGTAMPVAAAEASAPVSQADAGRSDDPERLKKIDTLIAFEDYESAGELLRSALQEEPGNADLRLQYVEAALGNAEPSAAEESILARIMMDGPSSATIERVQEIGRRLRPGHPLFPIEGGRAAAAADAGTSDGGSEAGTLSIARAS